MQPIILAAGKGTRMRSQLPKTLYPIQGRPMLDHILDAIESIPMNPPIMVVGYGADEIRTHLGESFIYAMQPELNGTAGAVIAALPYLPKSGHALILYGDQPFIKPPTLEKIAAIIKEKNPTFIQSTVLLPNFDGWRSVFVAFGRIVRDNNGMVEKIVEYKNASEHERSITEVNPGLIVVEISWLQQALLRIRPNEINQELYLTDLVALAKEDSITIETITLEASEALGINSPEDAQFAVEVVSKV